jgi:DNA alkylation damage repair protein AlkB
LLDLWNDVSGYDKPPEACLVNFYSDDAKMGLHQDKDEQDLSAPVVSISLGNACLFRVGGLARTDKTCRSSYPAAMWSFWAGRGACASTASTASIPPPRRC